jgi:hypothetical protein
MYLSMLNYFIGIPGTKTMRQGLIMIWGAVIWTLWRNRNLIVFENRNNHSSGLVEDVKILSWKWWLGRSKASPCLLYEWVSEPRMCPADWFFHCLGLILSIIVSLLLLCGLSMAVLCCGVASRCWCSLVSFILVNFLFLFFLALENSCWSGVVVIVCYIVFPVRHDAYVLFLFALLKSFIITIS